MKAATKTQIMGVVLPESIGRNFCDLCGKFHWVSNNTGTVICVSCSLEHTLNAQGLTCEPEKMTSFEHEGF